MAVAGLAVFAVAWAIPSLYELLAVVSPDVKGKGGRTAIPVYGVARHGVERREDAKRCEQADWGIFCGRGYIDSVYLFADAAFQVVGLGFVIADAVLSYQDPYSPQPGHEPASFAVPGSPGLSWTWRF